MRALPTRLEGLVLVEPVVHRDERGFFAETFRLDLALNLGVGAELVQDNQSRSRHGVLRGMHFQIGSGVAKLVRCARGTIFDVAVDVRRASPTYGQWEGFQLDDENMHQLYVPVGFAHGFFVLSEVADVAYRQSAYHDPALERSLSYADPDIAIEWPAEPQPLVSARDAAAPRLREIEHELVFARLGA